MTDVACFIAGVATPDDTMTSTLSRTNSYSLFSLIQTAITASGQSWTLVNITTGLRKRLFI
jgi:hypothetical protein